MTIPTDMAMATFFAGFDGWVAVGMGMLPLLVTGGGGGGGGKFWL